MGEEERNDDVDAGHVPNAPSTEGGVGGADAQSGDDPLSGFRGGTRDTRMLARAVEKRWDLPEAVRKVLPAEMTKIAVNQGPSGRKYRTRERIAAARVLVAMEAQNQDDEHKRQPDVGVNVHLSPEELAHMSDEDLNALRRRITGD